MGVQALGEGFDMGVSAYEEACDMGLLGVCRVKSILLARVPKKDVACVRVLLSGYVHWRRRTSIGRFMRFACSSRQCILSLRCLERSVVFGRLGCGGRSEVFGRRLRSRGAREGLKYIARHRSAGRNEVYCPLLVRGKGAVY